MSKQRVNKYKKFLKKTVEELKANKKFSWLAVTSEVEKHYPDMKPNPEKLRSAYRRMVNKSGHNEKITQIKTNNLFNRLGIDNIGEGLLKLTKRKHEVNNLAVRLNLDYEELLIELTKLELEGYTFDKWLENGKSFIRLRKTKPTTNENNRLSLVGEVGTSDKFLVISDTHIGHNQSKIDYLQEIIHKAYEQGVRRVYHVGDVTEGHYQSIRPTSIKELTAVGFDEQLSLANKVFPKLDGLTYYMISGNHDASFDRNAFANPVKTLALMRDDIKYLGHNFAKIDLTMYVDMVLVHPTDGIGQNYGLKLMQFIDRNDEPRLGRLIFMGHYHKFTHIHYKGRDAWVVPALVGQSDFMADKNIASIIGAMIINVEFDTEGELLSVTPQYFFLD